MGCDNSKPNQARPVQDTKREPPAPKPIPRPKVEQFPFPLNGAIYEIEPFCAPGTRVNVKYSGTKDGSRISTTSTGGRPGQQFKARHLASNNQLWYFTAQCVPDDKGFLDMGPTPGGHCVLMNYDVKSEEDIPDSALFAMIPASLGMKGRKAQPNMMYIAPKPCYQTHLLGVHGGMSTPGSAIETSTRKNKYGPQPLPSQVFTFIQKHIPEDAMAEALVIQASRQVMSPPSGMPECDEKWEFPITQDYELHNVRTAPNFESTVKWTLKHGAGFTVYGKLDGGWLYIEQEGKLGYCVHTVNDKQYLFKKGTKLLRF